MKLKKSKRSLYAIEGIYYSYVSGRIFEATIKESTVIVKYSDNAGIKGKKIPVSIFEFQKNFGLYNPIIIYDYEEM